MFCCCSFSIAIVSLSISEVVVIGSIVVISSFGKAKLCGDCFSLCSTEDSEAFDKGLITYIKCLPHYREENSLRNINKALELNHRDNEFAQARFNIFVESLNNIKESTVCTKLYFSGIKGDDILCKIASFLNWYDIKNLFLN